MLEIMPSYCFLYKFLLFILKSALVSGERKIILWGRTKKRIELIGGKIMERLSDFETWCMENNQQYVLAQWNYKKNDVTPREITTDYHQKVWWVCPNGHEWKATVNSRLKRSKCPYCSGLLPVKEKTDLTTTNPELLEDWNYEKNAINPNSVTKFSCRKVWWKCSKCGFEWSAAVCSRANGKFVCPRCNPRKTKTRKGKYS